MKKHMSLPFDLLLGRKTFDNWARFWPKHADFSPGDRCLSMGGLA